MIIKEIKNNNKNDLLEKKEKLTEKKMKKKVNVEFIQKLKNLLVETLIKEEKLFEKLLLIEAFNKFNLQPPFNKEYIFNKMFIEDFLGKLLKNEILYDYFYENFKDIKIEN